MTETITLDEDYYVELAEEYSIIVCGYVRVELAQAFLAGLKAGRPQWHKVADGDLPKGDKDKYYFVVHKMNVYMIARFYEGKWSNYSVIDDVIAWCEIPTFDKE